MNQRINITLKLFAQYREGNFKVEQRVCKSGTTPQDIIDELGITKHLPLGILIVNAKHENEKYVLQEGDTLSLFPKVGGG